MGFEDKIETEDFLEKYEAVDIESSLFFQRIKQVSESFYDLCSQIQDDILKGRISDRHDFSDESEFFKKELSPEILKIIGGEGNFGYFVRTKLFSIRQEWLENTPKGTALKDRGSPSELMNDLVLLYRGSIEIPGLLSTVSDTGVEKIKEFILHKGNQFPEATNHYLHEILKLPENIFLAKLIEFLKAYRIKVGIDSTREDFNKAMAA